jgi:hypothetical protein
MVAAVEPSIVRPLFIVTAVLIHNSNFLQRVDNVEVLNRSFALEPPNKKLLESTYPLSLERIENSTENNMSYTKV